MKIKIVTAYWMDVQGLPFLGTNPVRKERYLGSLISYCKNIDLPVICYTHTKNFDEINKLKTDNNLENLEIKLLELHDIKYHEKIQNIVNSDVERYTKELDGRGAEIMWGKFDVIERESVDCDRIFWLDIGLQHPGLFTWRHSKTFNQKENHEEPHKLGSWWANLDVYDFKYFFNTEVFQKLSKNTENKLCLITSNGPQIGYQFKSNGILSHDFVSPYPVGALVGGDTKKVKKYVELFWEFARMVIDKGVLFTEEAIMKPSFDSMDESEVITFNFDSFYCCEHDKFHFEVWSESWNEPKPFYVAWLDLMNLSQT